MNTLWNKEKFAQKIESALYGCAIGDALGVPTETMTQSIIQHKFNGRVTTYQDTKHNKYFQKYGFNKPWWWYISDDAILTFALIKSLNKKGERDFDDIMQTHIQEYNKFPYGFGWATTHAFKQMQNGVSYKSSWFPNAGGNGVLMKQFPVAAWCVAKSLDETQIEELVRDYTWATHGWNLALLASLLHNKFLMMLLQEDTSDTVNILQTLQEYIKPYEQKYPLQSGVSFIQMLQDMQQHINPQTGLLEMSDEQIKKTFARASSRWWRKNVIKKLPHIIKTLRIQKGKWEIEVVHNMGYVLYTLGISYALFFRNRSFDAVVDAVNIGGDTDSYAAIVGAMVGADQSIDYDDYYIDWLQRKNEIVADTKQFIQTLLQQ